MLFESEPGDGLNDTAANAAAEFLIGRDVRRVLLHNGTAIEVERDMTANDACIAWNRSHHNKESW